MKAQKQDSGSVIVAVLITSVVGFILFFGMAQWMQMNRGSGKRVLIHESASVINAGLVSILTNSASTQNILKDPLNAAALACTNPPFSCLNGQSYPLKISNYLQGAIDPTKPNYGFTFGGTFCKTFNKAHGTDACPLRFEVSAVFTCPGAPATPCSRVNFKLSYQIQIYGRSSTINYDPNYAVLEKGSLLTYPSPASMSCYQISIQAQNGPPFDSVGFWDNECLFSGTCPGAVPTPSPLIPALYGSATHFWAPTGLPPMWGVTCKAPYAATSCDTISVGASANDLVGSKNINNGCFTETAVIVTGSTVNNPVQITAHCCLLNQPVPSY
jgi:hypothetical protein